MKAPTLVADGLLLDAPRLDDAPDWSDAQDEECARWFGWPCPPGLERCRAHLERVVADADADSVTWAVRVPEGFAGGIDLARLEDRWNVSYFVHPRHRGRGIATGALGLVCAWARSDLGLSTITTRVHVGNSASDRVLLKAGFVATGEEPAEDGDHRETLYALEL